MAQCRASFFKQSILFLGIIASLQMKAEITSHSKSHEKTSAIPEVNEKREPIKVQPLQNEALKKLQELIACSSDQKDLSIEALSSKIKEALKSSASKFLYQYVDITIKNIEIPKDIGELKNVLKHEKLSLYFNKIFLNLYEEQTKDTYLKKATLYLDKGVAASKLFESIHKEDLSISKALTEAAQEIKSSSQKNQFVCEAKTKDLEIKILQKEKELKKTKDLENASTNDNLKETEQTRNKREAELEKLKKEAELNKAKTLLQSVNQPSEIREELLKKFPIKKDLSPEQVVDMKLKSEGIKNKEITLEKAQKKYNVENESFKNATKPNSPIKLEDSEKNKNEAQSALTKAKKEFDEAKSARNEIENLEKYSSAIKSIEDSFQELILKPESKNSQEALKYIKKNAPSLLDRDGKIKYANSDQIKEVKKILLEKLSEKSLMEKAIEGAKDFLKFRNDSAK